MNLYALKKKGLSSFSFLVITPSTLVIVCESLFKASSPTQYEHHVSIDKPKKKKKLIMKKVPYPQTIEELEELVLKRGPNEMPPTSIMSAPLEGPYSSRSFSRKIGERQMLMLDLCKGKPLPFMAFQIANLSYPTLDAPLQSRCEDL